MDIRKGIVGIKSDPKSKQILGTGFFVSGGIILTCAHVIDDYYQPSRQIDCLLEGETEHFKTNVIFFSPQPEYDLAILQPTTEIAHTPLPIASSQSSKKHSFSIFGYPAIDYRGLNGAGVIMGWSTDDKGHTTLQLDSDQITHGFSGAPVWDEELRVVVGMLQKGIKNDEIGRPSFALPLELAKEIYPDLQLGAATPAGGLPAGSYIPFPRNALFTGREKDITELAKNLLSAKPTETVITGMGGIGKTQLAVEFAYRHGHEFSGVHLIDLRDPATLDAGISLCGTHMGLAFNDQREQIATVMKAWLADGPRLIILDNFEDVTQSGEVLSRFQHPSLRVLITSRRKDFPKSLGLKIWDLSLFSEAESAEFLDKSLESQESPEEKKSLADRLGGLPLALELAANYINVNKISIAKYLEAIKDTLAHESMQADWFKELDISNPTEHQQSLLATFQLSWQDVKDETQQKVFMIAGYCAPNTPIPLEIFKETLELEDSALTKALYRLNSLGLLRAADGLPTIHPLLAAYARTLAATSKDLLEKLADKLATLAKQANDQVDQTGSLAWFAPYRSHVLSVAEFAEKLEIQDTANLLVNLGYYLKEIADFIGAKLAYERAIKFDESVYGTNHTEVAVDVHNLGVVLLALGELDGAKAAFERALKIDEAAFGPNHPKVAIRVNGLGGALLALGDQDGAKAAFERALKIDEAAFGPNHHKVAIRVNNLGEVLRNLGDMENAKAAFERALKIDEVNFGFDHPDVAIDVNNLGMVLRALGELDRARAAFERALKIDEATRGPEHPSVAIDINNLGSVLKDLGDLAGAKAAFERAIKIWEANLGPDHSQVATGVNNLGLVLQDLGDLAGAKAAFERALRIFKHILPEGHPNIKIVEDNLRALDPHRPAGTSPKSEREI